MRKVALILGILAFISVECFLVHLILHSGPDSKEFYATPINELGKPINELFHQQETPKAKKRKIRHPAAEPVSPLQSPPLRARHPQVFPRTLTFAKVEPYLGDPLPIQSNLVPVYGAIIEDPRLVKEALGEFLGFFHGKVIYVDPQAPHELIRQGQRMMLVVDQVHQTFYFATGSINITLKDLQEAAEVAQEYGLRLKNILKTFKMAIYEIQDGQNVGQLLAKLKEDPRFTSVHLDLITDLPIQVL